MSVGNLEKMLKSAPDVASWWEANKQTIETSKGVKDKWKRRSDAAISWLVCGGMVSFFCGFVLATSIDPKDHAFIHVLSVCALISGLGGVGGGLGGWAGATIFRWRHWASLSQHYKEATDRWGLKAQYGEQTFAPQRRAQMLAQLNELGIDPHYIVALRNLDLPNAWWGALNEEICIAEHEKQKQPQVAPTLEEVYVQIEQRTETAKNHVLRL